MITAIDTNVLLDILLPNDRFFESSAQVIEESSVLGSLVCCDLVYAELCIHFVTQRECDRFFEENEIRIEALTSAAHFAASRAWRTYRQQGCKRSRILADFLIGAHAQTQATRLVSRDRGFYQRLFPSLILVDPSRPAETSKE